MAGPIETITGSVTTSGKGSLRISAFSRRDNKSPEKPLHLAEKDQHSGVKPMGAPDIIQAGAKRTGTLWSKKRHFFENGVLLKLCISQSRPGSPIPSQSNIMLRAREGAALYRIAIDFPTDDHSRMSVGYIEGRFDILTVDEIKAYGVHKNAQGASELPSYEPIEEITGVTVSRLEAAINEAEKVKVVPIKTKAKDAGGGRVLLKQRRTRRINP